VRVLSLISFVASPCCETMSGLHSYLILLEYPDTANK
jgi:hypothetical protein